MCLAKKNIFSVFEDQNCYMKCGKCGLTVTPYMYLETYICFQIRRALTMPLIKKNCLVLLKICTIRHTLKVSTSFVKI